MSRTMELIILSQQGDKDARDTLVRENTGLVWSIVHRFPGRGCEVEDLFQIGVIGLMKAIDRFDTSYDVRFSTYAVPLIMGEIRRYFRDEGMIKVSRTLKENHWKIVQATQQMQEQLGREVTLKELSEAIGLLPEEIVMAMEANAQVESLNQPIGNAEGKELYLEDQITDGMNERDTVDDRIFLEQLISKLSRTERELIYMRYYLDCTQTAVAKELHMTQVQVSRLEKKLLQRMREEAGQQKIK